MSDRELLELAAKAAGISMQKHGPSSDGRSAALDNGLFWAPFDNDGDALRLAVKLNIKILRFDNMTTARPIFAEWGCDERDDGDPYYATRRAIVRAAAEIGKSVPLPITPD